MQPAEAIFVLRFGQALSPTAASAAAQCSELTSIRVTLCPCATAVNLRHCGVAPPAARSRPAAIWLGLCPRGGVSVRQLWRWTRQHVPRGRLIRRRPDTAYYHQAGPPRTDAAGGGAVTDLTATPPAIRTPRPRHRL